MPAYICPECLFVFSRAAWCSCERDGTDGAIRSTGELGDWSGWTKMVEIDDATLREFVKKRQHPVGESIGPLPGPGNVASLPLVAQVDGTVYNAVAHIAVLR